MDYSPDIFFDGQRLIEVKSFTLDHVELMYPRVTIYGTGELEPLVGFLVTVKHFDAKMRFYIKSKELLLEQNYSEKDLMCGQ